MIKFCNIAVPTDLNKTLLFLWLTNTHLALPDKPVSLEMYPFPALAGSSVTLKCLVWGTDLISNAGFYVNTSNLHKGTTTTYTIPHVTNSAKGSYKCDAVFEYTADRETLQETSDDQVLEVYGTSFNTGLDVFDDHCIFFFTHFFIVRQLWLPFQMFKWGQSSLKPVTTIFSAPALYVLMHTDQLDIAGTASTKAVISGHWSWKIPVGLCGHRRLKHTRAELCGKMEGPSLAEAVSFAFHLLALVGWLRSQH